MPDSNRSVSNLRRVSILACMLLVFLRISIGWQFCYEGLWKINSLYTSSPWTAAGYLKNAQGPLRNYFRSLTGDPDDLAWLDSKQVARQWTIWFSAFVSHYDLDENQQRQLLVKLNGPEAFYSPLERLPEGVDLSGPSLKKAIQFEADKKRLKVPGDWHLLKRERDALLQMAPVQADAKVSDEAASANAREFQKAVNRLYDLSSRLSFKERLTAMLDGDHERAGLVLAQYAGTVDHKYMGQIELYKNLLWNYEQDLAQAKQSFQYEHLKWRWRKIQSKRAGLVGPIKALDQELKADAQKLLTQQQLARGPVRLPLSPIDQINLQTMWGLTIIGSLLILGLFSRLSAIAGAGLLLAFYLANPPWPGVLDLVERAGPEHSYFIDKNLIEMIALLGIASLPTGRWFGLDAAVRRFIWRRTTD